MEDPSLGNTMISPPLSDESERPLIFFFPLFNPAIFVGLAISISMPLPPPTFRLLASSFFFDLDFSSCGRKNWISFPER